MKNQKSGIITSNDKNLEINKANSALDIAKKQNEGKILLRINAKTYIAIKPGVDPEEAKRKFLNKTTNKPKQERRGGLPSKKEIN